MSRTATGEYQAPPEQEQHGAGPIKRNRRSLAIALAMMTIIGSCSINFYLVARLDRRAGGDAIDGLILRSRKDAADEDHANGKFTTSHKRRYYVNEHRNITDKFREAGVELDEESIRRLPTWEQIESIIGPEPVMIGSETCEDFRHDVPPLRRMLGSAGMFNSGTNLVTRLMKENCVIPERYNKFGPKARKEQYGIRWQCPWGKHTPVKLKYAHTVAKSENITREDCLPIVTIRNPFDWMRSMCRIPYYARWSMREAGKGKICPHLVYTNSDKKEPVRLRAKLAEQWLEYDSLAHLWNEWYAGYWEGADFPFLMVRLEDLVFRQYETTKNVCKCAGGAVPPRDLFKYIVESAKQGPGHGKKEERTGMLDAWMKFARPPDVKAGFSDVDWEASLEFLSRELMGKMGYKFPPSE